MNKEGVLNLMLLNFSEWWSKYKYFYLKEEIVLKDHYVI